MRKTWILLAALVLPGCVWRSELHPGIHVYPSDLQPPVGNVLAWPMDGAGERFRFVPTDLDGWIAADAELGETAPSGAELLAAVPSGRVQGIVVLLPAGGASELRARAEALVDAYGEARPGGSATLLTTPLDFTRVEDGPTLSYLMQQARLRHRTERPRALAEALLLVQFQPRYVVVPTDPEAEGFVVIGSLWDDPAQTIETRHDADGAVEYIESRLASDRWDAPSVGVLAPEATSAEGRARCDALAERIEALRADQGLLVRGTLAEPWAARSTRDAFLNELEERGSIDRFLVGPVEYRFSYVSDEQMGRPAAMETP